jgi:D-methionine transport system ATP-binding protein
MGDIKFDDDVIFRLENVTKVFEGENKVVALDNVSLDINRGDIYGIIGMSGAGKSTLVRTLNRLEDVSEGSVLFEGRDLKSLNKSELRNVRQGIGMIFQGFNLLNQRTVEKNIKAALKIANVPKAEHDKIVDEMLKIVGLEDKKHAYPAQLSGGQKQRVAIARALSTNPKVILCDEATSALDPNITAEILDLLKRINRELKVTIIIITHEMSVVEAICDKVAVLNGGHIVENGPVKELFVNPKSEITRRLVYPESAALNSFDSEGRRCVILVFDGTEAGHPIIAELAAEKGVAVSILNANTKSIGGVGFGQMVVALPKDENEAKVAINYFKEVGVFAEEIEDEDDSKDAIPA